MNLSSIKPDSQPLNSVFPGINTIWKVPKSSRSLDIGYDWYTALSSHILHCGEIVSVSECDIRDLEIFNILQPSRLYNKQYILNGFPSLRRRCLTKIGFVWLKQSVKNGLVI